MRKILFPFGLAFLFFVSCKKDSNTFSGLYTEKYPVDGGYTLNFIGNDLLVKNEIGSSNKDTFSFSFSNGKILLTPTWTNQYPATAFVFTKIDNDLFQIENLRPHIPEAPKIMMTFKK
jgi:hypothetical protein